MKIDSILTLMSDLISKDWLYRRASGVSSYRIENELFVKAISFSLSNERDSEIIGMVHICAKQMYPLNNIEIDLSNYEYRSQISVQFQNFARGEWAKAPPKRPAFKLSEISSGERVEEFVEVVKKVLEMMEHVRNNDDLVDLIELCPRFANRHTFITRWLIAVWRGKLDPEDDVENAKLNEAVQEFNDHVKTGRSTKTIAYDPGQPFVRS